MEKEGRGEEGKEGNTRGTFSTETRHREGQGVTNMNRRKYRDSDKNSSSNFYWRYNGLDYRRRDKNRMNWTVVVSCDNW